MIFGHALACSMAPRKATRWSRATAQRKWSAGPIYHKSWAQRLGMSQNHFEFPGWMNQTSWDFLICFSSYSSRKWYIYIYIYLNRYWSIAMLKRSGRMLIVFARFCSFVDGKSRVKVAKMMEWQWDLKQQATMKLSKHNSYQTKRILILKGSESKLREWGVWPLCHWNHQLGGPPFIALQ